jgi:iron complex outermembrane recepter protein
MGWRLRRLLAGTVGMLASSGIASAQTVLPEIVVTAPSPIVRRAAVAPAVPVIVVTPEPVLIGTLPIVTDQFATVTVVPREEIARSPGASLGDVLFAKPGVTASTFAPGASRPIVRGQDNYRVRIQENGLAVNDVSEIGEDHGVAIDPLAARQIEVIRGPATLRFGSQAIGGVVNVDNNRIPTALPPRGFAAEATGAVSTVDNGREGGILVDVGKGNVAVHADAYARRADDYRIPGYPYLFPPDPAPLVNGRQPNSGLRSHGAALGGAYIFDQGFVGLAIAQFNSLYRIPGIEAAETNTRIDMRQTKITSKGEFRPGTFGIEAVRYWLGFTDYKHDELAFENGFDGVQQTFTNRAQEGRVEVQLMPFDLRFAALTSALGVQAASARLAAPGAAPGPASGLFDPNKTDSIAAYAFNELKFSDTLRLQLAGRIEQVRVKGASPDFPAELCPDPAACDLAGSARDLSFTSKSGAVGLLKDLPFGLIGSLTAQYVERAPRAPELLSRGVHEATGTFDIGNPNLKTEIAKSIEIGIRRAKGPLRFEATAYVTRFDGFIFRRLTGNTCAEDFASCVGPSDPPLELKQAIYSQRDAMFRGAELQAQFDVAPLAGGMFGIDAQYDVVRATFSDGSNVPRIPPQRLGGGVSWRDGLWFARVGLLHAFAQGHVGANETPTDGYNLLKAEVSYTRKLKAAHVGGPREFTVGVVGNNLLNADMRNHASFKKDEVLLPGVNVRVFANVKF